jgi:transposase
MLHLLESWRLKPAVEALTAFRGFQLVAAMVTVSELGDSTASSTRVNL